MLPKIEDDDITVPISLLKCNRDLPGIHKVGTMSLPYPDLYFLDMKPFYTFNDRGEVNPSISRNRPGHCSISRAIHLMLTAIPEPQVAHFHLRVDLSIAVDPLLLSEQAEVSHHQIH